VNTGLAMVNPNGQPATINFYFTDTSGNNFGQGSFTIPARGQIARFLNEAPFHEFVNSPRDRAGHVDLRLFRPGFRDCCSWIHKRAGGILDDNITGPGSDYSDLGQSRPHTALRGWRRVDNIGCSGESGGSSRKRKH